jgi:biopolymer transport protein ExbD
MRFPRNAKIFRGQLDAAPIAGILFVLVLFLVLSSYLVSTPGVRIELPEAKDLPGTDHPTLVVAVDRNGLFYYENQVIQPAALQLRLQEDVKRFAGPVTLVVQADKAVSYEVIVGLGRLARAAGLHEALLATRPTIFTAPLGPAYQP